VALLVHRRVLEQVQEVGSRKEQRMEQEMEHKMEQEQMHEQKLARMFVWVSHKHEQVVSHPGK